MWKTIDTAPKWNVKNQHRPILVGFQGQFEWIYYIAQANGKNTNAPGYAKPTHWYDDLPTPPVGVPFVPSNR